MKSSLWVLLIWDVWSERIYNRGHERTIAEQGRAWYVLAIERPGTPGSG